MTKYCTMDHLTWQTLLEKRIPLLELQACDLYLQGFKQLQLPLKRIPSCEEMNNLLKPFTPWRMLPVNTLITAEKYFNLLSQYQFPAITNIRPYSEIDFYKNKEPDVIHEYLGHAPFLLNEAYSTFLQKFAEKMLNYKPNEKNKLARIFWFTLEFGLIIEKQGLRAYGAGLIPSTTESETALYGKEVTRKEFNLVDILRTRFNSSDQQQLYYVISDFNQLYALLDIDWKDYLTTGLLLGEISEPLTL